MTTPATGFQTMFDRTTLLLGLAVLVAATVTLWVVLSRPALTPEKLRAAYAYPAPAPPLALIQRPTKASFSRITGVSTKG